jgi:hypothetical protein
MDPSLSLLQPETARVAVGAWALLGMEEALNRLGVYEPAERLVLVTELGGGAVFAFSQNAGDAGLRALSVAAAANPVSRDVFPLYRLEARVEISEAGPDRYSLRVTEPDRREALDFGGQRVLVKLPHAGGQTDPMRVQVVAFDGSRWNDTGLRPLLLHPPTGLSANQPPPVSPVSDGWGVFAVERPFAALALADAPAAEPPPALPDQNPADWASIRPEGNCSMAKCQKAYARARIKLKRKARLAMKAVARAQAATLKTSRPDVGARQRARLEKKAARLTAWAEQALQAFEQAAAAVKSLHD